MKTLTGHLTATNKKAIKAILDLNLSEGKVKNITYFISSEKWVYKVKYLMKDRGMIPCPGSELRVSTYFATFTI